MKFFKIIIITIAFFALISGVYSSEVYNQNGDFSVEVSDTLSKSVFNDNIDTSLSFVVESNSVSKEEVNIVVPRQSGWDVKVSQSDFVLKNKGDQKKITLEFNANSDFDYSPNVVSPDIVKISKKEDYVGNFEFPILISGEKENVSLKLKLDVTKRATNTNFEVRFSNEKVSPINSIRYTITGEDLELGHQDVAVVVELGNKIISDFTTSFSNKNNYKIFEAPISSEVSPGKYDLKTTIRLLDSDGKSAKEWYETKTIVVSPYENLVVNRNEKNTFFGKMVSLDIENVGNIKTKYDEKFKISFIDRFFLSVKDSNSNPVEYVNDGSQVAVSIPIEKGDKVSLNFSLNYMPLFFLFIIVVVIIVYMYIRISSNPLDVETRIYDIKKVEHEGIKSLKVRIGFENIKDDEIDTLKLIFRMPSYLNIKEDSFLLSSPNHVLKGKNQYKLEWSFKKFEKNDSRIIGFTLINSRGILGDVKIPDLELEVKVEGKTRRYFEAFPIIKG